MCRLRRGDARSARRRWPGDRHHMAGTRFAETFAALRAILEPHAKSMTVAVDKPGLYQLASPTMTDRVGRPLLCAWVQVNRNYVSYHLMPLYMKTSLRDSLSPALKTRMQGKSCFNFTSIESEQLKELSEITRKGIAGFKDLQLPWT